MDLHGKKNVWRSFVYAFEGLKDVVATEKNMRIHIFFALIVILFAWWLQIPKLHWLILLLVIGGVFVMEIMNSAIERVVDLVTEEYHPIAKRAKDASAAAVFVYTIFAVIIGMIMFLPPLLAKIIGKGGM